MNDTFFLAPEQQEKTRIGRGLSWFSSPPLPPDLQDEALRRVQWFSTAMLIVGITSLTLSFFIPFLPLGPPTLLIALHVPLLAFSLGLSVAAHWKLLTTPVILALALVYKIAGAAVFAALTNARPWPVEAQLLGWSPVAVWAMVFPLIVPSSTRRTIRTSLLALAMDPLAVWLYVRFGVIPAPPSTLLIQRFIPHGIALFLSVVVARMIYRLGSKLSAARELGSYHLVERLGSGGMGEVWRASHRMLARPAAVKLIRLGVTRGDEVMRAAVQKRFEREAQATAALRSPHTIGIFDFGIARDGSFYYVMELLDGLDLDSLVKLDGPQPPERVVHLLRQACHSLHEAHLAGLVHRDIKPANLFVCHYGADVDFVKVLDFGLVAEQVKNPEATALTGQHTITGTPAYMAPEMARGTEPIDGRADLYALGCVAYWLLTGQLVFPADTVIGMLMGHLTEAPKPPSTRSGRPVPPALEELILTCLEKDPELRPRSARELSDRLAALNLEAAWTERRAAEWWEEIEPARRARPAEVPPITA